MYLQQRDYSWYFSLSIPKALNAAYSKSEIASHLKSKRETQLNPRISTMDAGNDELLLGKFD